MTAAGAGLPVSALTAMDLEHRHELRLLVAAGPPAPTYTEALAGGSKVIFEPGSFDRAAMVALSYDIWDITPFNICQHIITYD